MNLNFKRIKDDSGSVVYRVDCVINSQRIQEEEQQGAEEIKNEESVESETEESNVSGNVVRSTWRLISCVKAWPHTGFPAPQLIDYGYDNGEVLKQCIPLINTTNPDLLWNHSNDSKDIAGYVTDAYWDQSTDIPPGVNGILCVDETFDPKAAKGLKEGFLRNGSIGVTMDIIPSHPKMEFEEFVMRQGEEIDGEIVRWLPKKVFAVRHMALVPAGTGADKYAGKRFSNIKNKQTKINSKKTEGQGMDSLHVLQGLLNALRIDYVIGDAENISEALLEKINARIEKLYEVQKHYQFLYDALYSFGQKVFPNEEFSLERVVESLELLHDYAEKGKLLLKYKKAEALEWFDKAYVELEGKTEATKRLRKRIEAITDIEHLDDLITLYKEMANEKFELNRSSIPNKATEEKDYDVDIIDSAEKIFGNNKK